jgi:hypothetical protein
MTTIEIKQNELDAKVASISNSQQIQTQAFNDIKDLFSTFLGGEKKQITIFFQKFNLLLRCNCN